MVKGVWGGDGGPWRNVIAVKYGVADRGWIFLMPHGPHGMSL